MADIEIRFDVSQPAKLGLARAFGWEAVDGVISLSASPENVPNLLIAARIYCLSKAETYFLNDASVLQGPLTCRNEAAAVSLLLSKLHPESSGGAPCIATIRAALSAHCERLWPEFEEGDSLLEGGCSAGEDAGEFDKAARTFHSWAESRGVRAGIRLAQFGSLRGCAATRALGPGDVALSIPRSVLIFDETIAQTDLGRALAAVPHLTPDNVLLLFTMIDRHDPDSAWAEYWASLPAKYYTGLSFPEELLGSLAGTAAALELRKAQKHLRELHAASQPLFELLLAAYPRLLQREWFSYESYLWAAELWYSYAFEVGFDPQEKADAPRPRDASAAPAFSLRPSTPSESKDTKPVMVPFACHVNHSPWPHVVRYGRLTAQQTLDFPLYRPCPASRQLFISYGPVPNLKLLCYYGFVIRDNPHDLVPLTLEFPEGPLLARRMELLPRLGLTLEHSLGPGSVSAHLLACLRLSVADDEELELLERDCVQREARGLLPLPTATLESWRPLETSCIRALNADNERAALATLRELLAGLETVLEASPLLAADEVASKNGDEWATSRRFCRNYFDGQRKIVARALEHCSAMERALGEEGETS
ncbi:hypothetical protein H632_c436p1 [Helicosporidium sp. ATCC 50920]|nr:hypothetical protein H632_c436p1 [Helicosporidium sp. ATCC 50920]|eukprot:KDD75922.1 hypothetical protein H632_c436p1 [Helicosporidium sp. ATCC 50920]